MNQSVINGFSRKLLPPRELGQSFRVLVRFGLRHLKKRATKTFNTEKTLETLSFE